MTYPRQAVITDWHTKKFALPERATWLHLTVFICLLLPLMVTPVLPLIDLYNHVARYFVLANIRSDIFLARNYSENWLLLPNIGLDWVATYLVKLLTPLQLAKVIVASILALQYFGTIYLNRALTGRTSSWSVLIAASLGFSFVLNWGFINYLLGAGMMLWTLGLWVTLRARPMLATIVCSPLAVAIFLTHGFAFAIYGLMLGGIELGRFLSRPGRHWSDLFATAGLLFCQAITPIVLFLNTQTMHAQAHRQPLDVRFQKMSDAGEILGWVALQVRTRAESFLRVAETDWPALDISLFIATAVLVSWSFYKGWLTIERKLLPPLFIAAALIVFLPGSLFGAGHLHERMPLLFFTIFAACLVDRSNGSRQARSVLALLVTIAAFRLAVVTYNWSEFRQRYEDFEVVAAKLEPNKLLAFVQVQGSDLRDGVTPRCQMYPSLAVIEPRTATPLFADPTQQPILVKERLLALAKASKPASPEQIRKVQLSLHPYYYDEKVADISKGRLADFLLLCAGDRLLRPLPGNLELLERRGNLALYRIN